MKSRVESLIEKDYLERDAKDASILVYQPLCVCWCNGMPGDLEGRLGENP